MSNESNLVGCCLCGVSSFERITEAVTAADFGDRDLGEVFAAIVDLFESQGQSALTERSILQTLQNEGKLKLLGDNHQVAELVREGRFAKKSTRYFAETVAKEARTRQAISTLQSTVQQIKNGRPWAEVAQNCIGELQSIDTGEQIENPLSGPEVKRKSIESLRSNKLSLCPSGLFRFDNAFGGFSYGGLTVMAARTSVGKSLVSADIAIRAAEAGKRVLLVSLEMTDVELGYRFLSRGSDIPLQDFKSDRIHSQIGELEGVEIPDSLFVWIKPQVRMEQINAMVRRLKASGGLDLVVIDYLGLMGGRSEKIYEKVTENSQRAKHLAVEHNVAVLMCSQLNREAEKQEPTLANLALSGSVEQDADMVIFLIRDKVREPRKLCVSVVKNRNGQLGKMDFEFEGEYARLSDNMPMENWQP